MPVVLLALSATPVHAQQIVREIVGVRNQTRLGVFEFLGDLDRDGYEDIGVQAWAAPRGWYQILLLSGKDGSVMRKVLTPSTDWRYSIPLRAGDWNGDGNADYVTHLFDARSTAGNIVQVRSGRDDRPLAEWRGQSAREGFGVALAGVHLDADRKPDLIFTMVGGSRYYWGLSNAGKILWVLELPIPTPAVLHHGKVGDVDGDGCDDFGFWNRWDRAANSVYVISGRTGRFLYAVNGERPNDFLGSGMTIPISGDVDGDGRDDFAVSSSGTFPVNGVVRVFSGRTGKAIWTFRKSWLPYNSSFHFGTSIASGQDLDQDGVNDLVVGCLKSFNQTNGAGGRAFVFSLRTGREIAEVFPTRTSYYSGFGCWVRTGSRLLGNPFPLFAALDDFGAPEVGRITVYRMLPKGVTPFGNACKGALRIPPRLGFNDLGNSGVRVHLSQAPRSTAAFLLLGLSDKRWGNTPLPFALDPFGFPGCKLFTSVDAIAARVTGATGIDRGYTFVDVPWPLATSNPRLTLHGQWLVLGSNMPSPGAVTGALRWSH